MFDWRPPLSSSSWIFSDIFSELYITSATSAPEIFLYLWIYLWMVFGLSIFEVKASVISKNLPLQNLTVRTMISVEFKNVIKISSFLSSTLPLVTKTNYDAKAFINKTRTRIKKKVKKGSSPVEFHVTDRDLNNICKSHPGVPEIEYILNTSSSAICQRDSMDKLPLHVACERGASFDVVEVLISKYESACMIADADGKLPIHHLCENYVRNSDPILSLDEVADDFLMILELMLQSSSSSLLKLDKNGFSPLEHAIEANLDYALVYRLQKRTEKLLKSRMPLCI